MSAIRSLQELPNTIVILLIGFFVAGIMLSAFFYPMAATVSDLVFSNTTGYYWTAPTGSADLAINYGVFVVFDNIVLFVSLAIMLIILGAVLGFMKFKK